MTKFRSERGPAGSNDYLEELILQGVGEVGKVPINDEEDGFKTITVPHNVVTDLSPPETAVSATIMVEADATAVNKAKCVRFTENDAVPTAAAGFFLGDGDIYEVSGSCLANFSMLTIETGKTTTIQVQFYSSIKTT